MCETENGSLPHAFDDTSVKPPPGGYPGNIAYDRTGWWWFNYISDYSRKDKKRVLWCPSRRIEDSKLKGHVLHGNYGVNRSIFRNPDDIQIHREEFIGKPLHSSGISHPGQTLLVADSGYSMITWWHAADTPPYSLSSMIEDTAYIPGLKINKERNLWPGQWEDAVNGRHPNTTVNVGFADGHVSRKKADELLVEKIGDGYKNRSPLWVPK